MDLAPHYGVNEIRCKHCCIYFRNPTNRVSVSVCCFYKKLNWTLNYQTLRDLDTALPLQIQVNQMTPCPYGHHLVPQSLSHSEAHSSVAQTCFESQDQWKWEPSTFSTCKVQSKEPDAVCTQCYLPSTCSSFLSLLTFLCPLCKSS